MMNPYELHERKKSPHYENDEQLKKQYKTTVDKARQGYFIRITEHNIVFCPQGEVLHKKTLRKNGYTRYSNKMACKFCKDKCCSSPHKELDVSPSKNVMPTPLKRKELKENLLT